VLSNLLDNAIKYSPDGGMIEVAVAQPDDATIELSVRDHGMGIPAEKRGHIFDRFYQAHGAEHRSGLGLGLYICRQIVELHDGAIRVEFPPDGGTRFVVCLPLITDDLAAARARHDGATPAEPVAVVPPVPTALPGAVPA
jgi:signal transduction histidine kinase